MADNISGNKTKARGLNKSSYPQGPPHNQIKIEVYKHYQELARNEDRLFSERLMLCFVGHSILFAGFIMSFEFASLSRIRIVLSSIGILLSVFSSIFLAHPAWKAWKIWLKKLKEIEKTFEESGLTVPLPYKAREDMGTQEDFPWIMGCWIFPLLFFILWLVSLISAV